MSLILPAMLSLIFANTATIARSELLLLVAGISGMEILVVTLVLLTAYRAYRAHHRGHLWLIGIALLLLTTADTFFLVVNNLELWSTRQTSPDIASAYLAAAFLAALAALVSRPHKPEMTSGQLFLLTLLFALVVFAGPSSIVDWLPQTPSRDGEFRIVSFAVAAVLYALAAISLQGHLQTPTQQTRQLLLALSSLSLASLCQMANHEAPLLTLLAHGYRLVAYLLVWRFLMSAADAPREEDSAGVSESECSRIDAVTKLLVPESLAVALENDSSATYRLTTSAPPESLPLIDEEQSTAPSLTQKLSSSDLQCLVAMAEISSDLIALSTADGHLRYLNVGGRAMLGVDSDTDIGKLMVEQVFPSRRQDLRPLTTSGPSIKAWQGETQLQRPNSDRRLPVLETEFSAENCAGSWLLIARDLSELENSKKELWQAANCDALTGLPNRQSLDERLISEFVIAEKEGRQVMLACLSIGRFKDVNDAFGQGAGDAALRELAKRIRAAAPASCTVARIGGAEFGVIVPHLAAAENAENTVRMLQQSIARPVHLGSSEILFTCSIGIAIFPFDAKSPQNLITAADIALRRAKRQGGKRWEFYTHQMDREVREQVLLEAHLRQALIKDELRLEYQPQVSLHDGMIVGVEALIRWQHPLFGMIQPDRFIPIAEASGLIIPIGEWVLRSAALQQVAWTRAKHAPLRMGINLSAQQFHDTDLVAQVENAIAYSDIAPGQIELEITETVLMEDAATAERVLRKLSAMGVSIAIDDFGTGYSSLAYVKAFPIDRIKVDRSFIQDIPGDATGSVITQSILSLAKSLGLHTIAEGVETQEQVDFLRSHGCDELQGYLLSRPLPPTQVEELLDQHQPFSLRSPRQVDRLNEI
jgi:diguanylate cyclase (GGDEF)-like protein